MGKKAIEIINIDVNELINELNKAFADEWLAYYQYWIAAQVVTGLTRQAVVAELISHANDELRHAQMLAQRIIRLGGTPILDHADWSKMANCSFLAPTDPQTAAVVKQALAGERCAITVYNDIIKKIRDKDNITYQMIVSILDDELTHEDDLETLLKDMGEPQ